jgi:hypothetical protein
MAHGCPSEIKKIDAATPTSKLSAQDAEGKKIYLQKVRRSTKPVNTLSP